VAALAGESNAGDRGQQWIAQLFKMIDAYEASPTTFDGEGFMELYAKVERAIELSGESESHAFALDQALFNGVSVADVDDSDLRFVVGHALTIHHRYHADYGRGFEQAYKWCETSRAQPLPDLRFIHTYVLPRIGKKDAFGNNADVALFLMERIGRFENLENSPVWDDEKGAELLGQDPPEIAYQLARRRVKYIAEPLINVPNSLEQQLNKDGAFKQLHRDSMTGFPLLSHQIENYGYMRAEPFLKRMGAAISGVFRGLVHRMAGEYMAYELTKRNGAYVVQTLLIVLILLGFAMASFAWALRSNSELDAIQDDLTEAQRLVGSGLDTLNENVTSARNDLDQY
jgi:hypothetical protein